MLTPEQIDGLQIAFEQLADPVTDYLVRDVARRVSQAGQLTSTASYQIWRLQELGKSLPDVEAEVAKILNIEINEVDRLFTQAAEVGYRFDIDRLNPDAVPFRDNTSVQQITNAAVKLAGDKLRNLTQTLGFVGADGQIRPLTDAYLNAADYAFRLINTGAADYNTAIRKACAKLSSEGIRSIDYESGAHTSLEAAIRRDMMGGLGLMTEQISEQNHDDLGANGWEISAHAASAPDHEPIQGKQYSDKAYRRLNESLKRRIGTLNCGHTASPVILGVNAPQYTPAELNRFREDNAKGVDYEGKHFDSVYEATQYQRRIERAVRAQKRRVMVADSQPDKETAGQAKTRLSALRAQYTHFCKATGLRTENERLFASGFGKARGVKISSKDVENKNIPVILSDDELYSINLYKSAKSYQINAALRGENPITIELRETIEQIDKAVEKLPVYEGTVYRSLRSEEMVDAITFLEQHKPGSIVTYPAFTSSGTEIYDDSMDIQIIIQSKQGRDMRMYNPLEQEILFKRGSRFLVEKREGKKIWLKEI